MRMLKRVGALVAVTGLVLVGAGISTAQAGDAPQIDVTLCHRTGSVEGGNTGEGYVVLTVNINSVRFAEDARGHDGVHEQVSNGPLGDIIPKYTYDLDGPNETVYEGKNLGAGGQAFLNNGCKVPDRPMGGVVTSDSEVKDCVAKTIKTTTVTTTTTWNLVGLEWVKTVTPITTSVTRDASALVCPGKPDPEIVVTSSDDTDCVAKKITTTTVTKTTGWKLENNKWVKDSTVTTQNVTTRDATTQECEGVPLKPSPEIVVTSSEAKDCPADEVSTTTVTKTTGWKLVNKVWVKDSTVTTQKVTTRDATQAECPVEVLGVGGVAPTVTPRAVTPRAVTPAVASPAVASPAFGSPASNPLPAAAAAGDADTRGQLAAGSLTGLAALMMLGAGFLLRRRHGEV